MCQIYSLAIQSPASGAGTEHVPLDNIEPMSVSEYMSGAFDPKTVSKYIAGIFDPYIISEYTADAFDPNVTSENIA